MKETNARINVNRYTSNKCEISISISLFDMYHSGCIPKNDDVKSFIESYLPTFSNILLELLEQNNNSLKKFEAESDRHTMLRNKLFEKRKREINEFMRSHYDYSDLDIYELVEKLESDDIKRREYQFVEGIYSLAGLIIHIDNCLNTDESIFLNNSIADYEKGLLLIKDKMIEGSLISLGVSSFIIGIEQCRGEFVWSKHYNATPDISYVLRSHCVFQNGKKALTLYPDAVGEGHCFATDVYLLIDLYRIRTQYLFEKFRIILLFIALSDEYDEWMKNISFELIGVLSEVMFCGRVHRVIFQEKKLEDILIDERGSTHATTRMSLIISASNDDFFVLRIDLPHKGEQEIHINMEEVIGDRVIPTGYPLSDEEYLSIRLKIGNDVLEKLFYECNNQYWFVSDFQRKLGSLSVADDVKSELLGLFHKCSHKTFKTGAKLDDDKMVLFVNEIKEYACRFGLERTSYVGFDKTDIDYAKTISRFRGLFLFQENLLKSNPEETRFECSKVLLLLEKYMGIEASNKKVDCVLDLYDTLVEYLE